MRVRLSFSNVISLLALFIALGGASYAAVRLPRNSVGPTQLRTNAVTSAKVRNHSLRAVDFAKGQLPSGKPGATGLTGPQGPKGADGAPGSNGAPGTNGTNGTDGIGLNGFFGSGSGGSFVVNVDTGIGADFYPTNLTISAGKTLHTNGFRVFVSGTLTLGDGSHIERDGNPGNQGFGGAALGSGTLGLGGHGGGNNCQGDLTQPTNSLGGGGGTTSCGGGLATAPQLAVGGTHILDSATSAITGRSLDGAVVNGGAGGRGGSFTGGGGGGGVVVAARNVVVTGSASITANGGRSGGSDSGGGGGGFVVVISTSPQPAGVTLSAAGGPVGTGGGGDNGGTAGSPGFTEWLN